MAGFFDTLFGGGAEKEAADKNRQAIAQYVPQAQGYLKDAYTTGQGNLGQAIGAYAPLATLGQQYNQAGTLNLDALGVNGPEGNARATQAFQAGPGYNFMRDQMEQAVARRRAGNNMYDSGNTDIDLTNQIGGVANQEFQNWLKNLQQGGQMGMTATTNAAQGQGQGYTNLANLAQTYGTNQTGVAGNALSGNMDANKLQAAGEAAGAKNLLSAGMSVASLAAGGMGGGLGGLFGGGSGLGSALGGMGITYGQPGTSGSNLFGPVR